MIKAAREVVREGLKKPKQKTLYILLLTIVKNAPDGKMSDSKKLIEDTFAFARYLSWADLQKTLFETETDIEPVPTEPTAVRKHEWRRLD